MWEALRQWEHSKVDWQFDHPMFSTVLPIFIVLVYAYWTWKTHK